MVRHWPRNWLTQANSWAPGDRVYCNSYSGTVLRQLDEHPLMGGRCFELQIDNWDTTIILSAWMMEMFVKVTG